MANRTYRDPIHGSITFQRGSEDCVIELIDSAEFQRLRRIRQLGAASFVFPGGEHSRFAHSLGVAHLAKRMLEKLEGDPSFPTSTAIDKDELKKTVIVGALLHDIGHGPFSHLFERVFNEKKHEEWGLSIIDDAETNVHGILRKYSLVDSVKKIFQKTLKPRFLLDIISSQLDADRLDYLLRDSYMTGVAYGRYDLDWLAGVIELAQIPTNGSNGKEKDWGLAINYIKGKHASEQFVIGRYLMYQQVYFHKTIRSAERMVKLVFERLKENAQNGRFPDFCPKAIKSLLESGTRKLGLKAYLELDDALVWTCFKMWSQDEKEDDVIKKLSLRLINRDLFKTAVVDPDKVNDDMKYHDAITELESDFQKAGYNPKYYLAFDAAEDFPYRDMMWYVTKGKLREDIWLAKDGKVIQPLSNSTVSPLIESLRNNQLVTKRWCYPGELRETVLARLSPFLLDQPEGIFVPKPRTATTSDVTEEIARS